MASSERVQRALAAASALSTEERAELIGELILSPERERNPEPGYDEAWASEIRRRVDAVVGGASKGAPLVAGAERGRSAARRAAAPLGMIVESEAGEELFAAAAWYDDQRSGLGDEFLAAVDEVLERVAVAPLSYPKDRFDERARRALVTRFPFAAAFVVEDGGSGSSP